MKKIIAYILISIFVYSCGKAEADLGYRVEYIHGYKCITNDKTLWCDPNG